MKVSKLRHKIHLLIKAICFINSFINKKTVLISNNLNLFI